jgi:hypothetical protein
LNRIAFVLTSGPNSRMLKMAMFGELKPEGFKCDPDFEKPL